MFSFYGKMKLSNKIFLSMIAGSALGLIMGPSATQLQFIGDIWLNMIKMIIVPLVIFMIVQGISGMENPRALGRILLKLTLYYAVTTIAAVLVGVCITQVLEPGLGFEFQKAAQAIKVDKLVNWQTFLVNLFSDNMFASFTKADIPQVLVIGILLGLAIVFMPKEKSGPTKAWFQAMAALFMSVVGIVMALSPIGVFCLMASALGKYGLLFLGSMSKLVVTYYLACLVQLAGVYLLSVWLLGGMSPLQFLRKTAETTIFCISTCSSTAAIPLNLKVSKERLEVREDIADFAVPFGTQINHDGNAIMFGCVILFCMQAIGESVTSVQLIQMVILGVIVSFGGGGIPSAGIVKLMVVAQAFNMPLEIVAIVGSLYRLFDMATTTLNCLGDLAGIVVIDRLEKKKNPGAA
jgi:Na+/H+-dicarboxylate symporter